ncbi:MAG: molybdenum cofactor biosynthesis protein MoaE [Pelagibacterales bacterium]|nr:molybdenum cofactor biosynthesis protein MoaE [Pelagibacterales bacterium]
MIKVQKNDFNIGHEISEITSKNQNIGGISTFIGIVRGGNNNSLNSMTLEHYSGMTEKMLNEIDNEAKERWDLIETKIIHRYGELFPGDQIVLVITASEHRKNAIESCQFLIDWLKTKAPFWKLEDSTKGKNWVEEKQSDLDAASKWKS